MSTKNSDKSLVNKVVIISAALIVLFHIAWIKNFMSYFPKIGFLLPYIGLWVAFVYTSLKAYKNVDTIKDNASRAWLIAVTVLFLFWLGGWASGLNDKRMFENDIKQVNIDGLYSDTNHLPAQIPE
jgi:hypothetical protein